MRGKLLDTNVLIDLAQAQLANVTNRYVAELAANTPLSLSSISVFEFLVGIERSSRHAMQLVQFEHFLERMQVLDFTHEDASVCAIMKAGLLRRGVMIGAYDLLIASQAMARGLTLVTANIREFSRIEGLDIEDWTVPQSA